jgi:hypothetical protein
MPCEIKSNIAAGDLRQRPRRPPAADAEIQHRRAWPEPALEQDLFTGLQLLPLRIGPDDGGIAVGFQVDVLSQEGRLGIHGTGTLNCCRTAWGAITVRKSSSRIAPMPFELTVLGLSLTYTHGCMFTTNEITAAPQRAF